MSETLRETQARQQTVDITSIQKDVEYIKSTMKRNFEDHKEIKEIFERGLASKIGQSRFKPVEWIAYGLAGGVLMWALNQFLGLIETAKALF